MEGKKNLVRRKLLDKKVLFKRNSMHELEKNEIEF